MDGVTVFDQHALEYDQWFDEHPCFVGDVPTLFREIKRVLLSS